MEQSIIACGTCGDGVAAEHMTDHREAHRANLAVSGHPLPPANATLDNQRLFAVSNIIPPANITIDASGAATPRKGTNGMGIPLDKLRQSPGRPRGARNLHAKHPSSIAKAFKKAGLDWQVDFALAIKAASSLAPKERAWGRERIKLWLRLLPYLITQRNHSTTVRRWKGKASRAAMVALQALEGK